MIVLRTWLRSHAFLAGPAGLVGIIVTGATGPVWAAQDVTIGSLTLPGWVWSGVAAFAGWAWFDLRRELRRFGKQAEEHSRLIGHHGREIARLKERTR